MRPGVTRWRILPALLLVVLTGAIAAGLSRGAEPPVTRDVLVATVPGDARRERLELVRFTIAPGTRLAPHTHPGTQAVRVVSGTLGYTVLRGSVRVRRARGGVDVVRPGREATIRPGDSFVETRRLAHFGRNPGTKPLVLLVASLLDRDQPPSLPLAR